MDVRHPRYFVEVARAGTIAAASVSLSMEASPLSRRIRDLERHLGAPLLARGGRRPTVSASRQVGSSRLPGVFDSCQARRLYYLTGVR